MYRENAEKGAKMTRVILNTIKVIQREKKKLDKERNMKEYEMLEAQYKRLREMEIITQLTELPEEYMRIAEMVYYEDNNWTKACEEYKYYGDAGLAVKKTIERAILKHNGYKKS